MAGLAMGTPILVAEQLGRVLAGEVPVTLVRELDLTVERGEFLTLLGPSGSGKTMFAMEFLVQLHRSKNRSLRMIITQKLFHVRQLHARHRTFLIEGLQRERPCQIP